MLKGKIKLSEKVQIALPHKLSCLSPVFEGKDEEENAGAENEFESGEELVILHPNQRGLQAEIDVCSASCDDKYGCIPEARVTHKQLHNLEAIVIAEKRSDLEFEISQKDINLEKLQRMASSGVPDGGSLRATIWKLMLGYLPAFRDLWEKELVENRLKYHQLKTDLLLSPSEFSRRQDNDLETKKPLSESYLGGPLERHDVSIEDHPLSLGKTSVWHQYFEFSEISEQIDRDLQRTHPNLEFFAEDSSIGRKNKESMRNILVLFAKLNPEIRYVQGMNEILAPMYFVFSTDSDVSNAENAEADAFSCFVRLMSDSLDHFCEQLDNSSVGIRSTLSRLSELLKANDEELWRHLELLNKVDPQFYAFRWITLLLTQEFSLKTILRIWDSLISNPFGIQDILLRICCAMLMCVRRELLSGDFVNNLKLLQHYPEIDVDHILQVAQGINPDTCSFHSSL